MLAKELSIYFICIFWSVAIYSQVGLSPDELKLFNLLNQEREKAGLPKLQWDYHLAESARAHTQLMVQRRALSHQLSGEPALGDRIGATGLRFTVGAENVAEGSPVEDLHAGLMNSPPHRANILSTDYNAVGLAVFSRDHELYATQNFAHVLPSYSEEQFRTALVGAFNKARHSARMSDIGVRTGSHVHHLACSGNSNPGDLINKLYGASDLVIFTSSVPEDLPAQMKKRSTDGSLHLMDIGVCFRPDKVHGYGNFWVVAAFYP